MMRRLFLCCLISLPMLVHAETNEGASIPPPPELAKPSKASVNSTQSRTAKPDAANDAGEPVAAPEPPDLPLPVHSGENLDPDITIIRKGEETIQEFRHNGELYLVKIIPDFGPAYYLIDLNGDGKLDVQKSDLDRGTKVNMWKIWDWK